MKEENMKLLDLQTGKYLELGEKGFFYGGKTITCPPTKTFNIRNGDHDLTLHIYADTERDYDIECLDDSCCPQFQITIKSNNQKLIGSESDCIDMRFNRAIKQSEPQGILKTLCDKTGAVVYGGRYVLVIKDYNIQIGDLWKNSKYRNTLVACINFKNNIHFKHNISGGLESFFEEIRNDDNDNIIVRCSQNENSEFLGNIFEEYSKQLRKEENKFDELMEKLN